MSPTDYAVSQKVIRGLIFVILSLKLAAKKKKKKRPRETSANEIQG